MPKATTLQEKPQTVEEKLDTIILYLHRMERRDRARMIGSYIHGMIWLISILFVIWSSWYFIAYGPQLIKEMTEQMINQSMGINTSAEVGEESSSGFMKMLEGYMKGN